MFIQSRQAVISLLMGLWLMQCSTALCQTANSSLVEKDQKQSTKNETSSIITPSNSLELKSLEVRNEPLYPAILEYKLENQDGILSDNKVPIRMIMGSSKTINITVIWDAKLIANPTHINLRFQTISPQIDVLLPQHSNSDVVWYEVKVNSASGRDVRTSFIVTLRANYIGHAIIKPELVKVTSDRVISGHNHTIHIIPNDSRLELPVTVIRDESVWEIIFIVSVTVLVVASYINLGAQLDLENLKQTLKKPKTMLLGFLLTVVLMPIISWFSCKWLIPDQLLYRIGSFVFAITPAASASTLWTVMLEADKELSVSLQVLSTFGSLLTMPISLYIMDCALQNEGSHYMIKVPYTKLIQSISVLLLALFVGWRLLGRSDRLRKISSRVFKPFIFAVLFFIIIFSSSLYWFIYRLFNWTITFNSFFIAFSTYVATAALGYLINFNLDHAITISISSAYKNSGIAFAVLLVAFETPDYFIAYVPCLTQVVITSLILYTIYTVRLLFSRYVRRNQPDPIQATKSEDNSKSEARQTVSKHPQPDDAEEEEEFIDVNVTDVPANNSKLAAAAHPQ